MSPQPSQEYEFLVPFQQVLYKKTIEAFTRLYPPYLLPRPLITMVISSSQNYSLGNRMLEYLAKSHSLPAGLPFYKLSNGKAFKFFLGQPNQSPEKGKEFLEITQLLSFRSRPGTRVTGFLSQSSFLLTLVTNIYLSTFQVLSEYKDKVLCQC